MNRTPAIVLALLLLAMGIVVALLFVRLQNLPAGAQAALNGYLRYRQSHLSPPTLSVGQAILAGNPSQFAVEMSGVSFGGNQLYRTTHSYLANDGASFSRAPTDSPLTDSITLSDSLKFNAFHSTGSLPTPFPPVEVWCVVLNERSGPARIVFVAFHRNLGNADWLVHEPPAYANIGELNERLAGIACNLDLGQIP